MTPFFIVNNGTKGSDSVSYFAGWTIVGTIPVVDVPADIRDLVASIRNGSKTDIGINVLALLPLVVSDIPQIGKNVVKFIGKYPGKIDELAIGIGKRFPNEAETIARYVLGSDKIPWDVRVKFANKIYIEKLASRIADGHSYKKHVLGINNPNGKEYGALFQGIQGKEEFAKYIESVIKNPSDKYIKDNRALYWDDKLGSIVIDNPVNPTAFKPQQGKAYFYEEVNKMKGD